MELDNLTGTEIIAYEKWIKGIGKKYFRSFWDTDKEDIIASGWVGMVNALQTYAPNTEYSLRTHSYYKIISAIDKWFFGECGNKAGLTGIRTSKIIKGKRKKVWNKSCTTYISAKPLTIYSVSDPISFDYINGKIIASSLLKFLDKDERQFIQDLYGIAKPRLTTKELNLKYEFNPSNTGEIAYRKKRILAKLRQVINEHSSGLGLCSIERNEPLNIL